MQQYQIYINGEWRDPVGGVWFESDEPYRAAPWARIPRCGIEDVDLAVAAASAAFEQGSWSEMKPTERGRLLRNLGDVMTRESEHLARVEARDNGKRLSEAVPQFKYLPQWLYYYAGLADKIEGTVIPLDIPGVFNYTRREPLGVIAAITPWNSPIMLMLWKIAPALAAGNTVVVKPSELASASTLEFMKLIDEAGLPAGVVNLVTGFGEEAGAPLVTHPDVAKVTFTGSVTGGKAVNRAAADGLKRVTLELGGKSPQLIFEDANLENAVNGVISGIFLSNGQTCVAGSRVLVHKSVKQEFIERLSRAVADLRMGDPTETSTQIGPIANQAQFEKILTYLDIAAQEGATCVTGGHRAQRDGWFVEPTVFVDVNPGMRIVSEEIFGPVLGVMTFESEAEAIDLANQSEFGLAAGVWTENMRRAHRLAEKLRCGTVYVNTYRAVSVMSPAGGFKMSGIGRENGQEMIGEYLQTKSVWVSMQENIPNPLG